MPDPAPVTTATLDASFINQSSRYLTFISSGSFRGPLTDLTAYPTSAFFLLALQLFNDYFPEMLIRHITLKPPAVYKKSGGRIKIEIMREFEIALYRPVIFLCIQRFSELLDIQAKLPGIGDQAATVKFGRFPKEQMMHLFELPLLARAQCRFSGYAREIVVLVRIEFYYEFYLPLEFIFDSFYDRTGRNAMRSLIIDKLDKRDRHGLRAYERGTLKRYGKTFYLC